jgi:hypothetical protein
LPKATKALLVRKTEQQYKQTKQSKEHQKSLVYQKKTVVSKVNILLPFLFYLKLLSDQWETRGLKKKKTQSQFLIRNIFLGTTMAICDTVMPHRLCFFACTLHQFETFSNKGLVHPVKRGAQLKEILKRDYVDDEVFVFPWVFSQ